jgi:uncharacterized phage protein (TIGR02218 family)
MKNASPALMAFLNAARSRDFPLVFADCFTFALVNAGTFFVTNFDTDVTWNGNTFVAGAILVSGMKFKVSTGLEVDRQQITISAPPGQSLWGSPWGNTLRDGAFDGAAFQRDRVFFDPSLPNGMDGVTLFRGRVSTVDGVGRSKASVTIASPLVVLDYFMPRNIFSPTCVHVLYDSGCHANAGQYAVRTIVSVGSTVQLIMNNGANKNQAQGSIVFNSGLNAGIRSTIKSVNPGVSWLLMYPLPDLPAPNDLIEVYYGCDHTYATCGSRFNNQRHFRGFPNVPPPDYAV